MAEGLQQRGFNVTTALAEDLATAPDDEVWEWAIAHGRVVVTYNYCDFIDLWNELHTQGREHPGLVLVYDVMIRSSDIGGLIRALEKLLTSGRDLTNLQEVLAPVR